MSEGHHAVPRTLTLLQAGDCPLTLVEVKQHLRVETDDDDDLIEGLMAAAQAVVDGRDGRLGRALLTQQWQMQRERFSWYPYPYAGAPYDYGMMTRDWAFDPWKWRRLFEIRIPLPVLVSIDSITYLDPNYNEQTLVEGSDFRVVAGGGGEARILPIINTVWPATAIEPDAVTINFTCGYPDAATLATERKGILQAMKLMLALWYENREAALVAQRAAAIELPFAVEALLAPHRLHML